MIRSKKSKIIYLSLFLILFMTLNITVIQLTAAAGNIQFSTYFGGTDDESQEDVNDLGKMSIEIDKNDNLIIVGRTHSSDYPVTMTIPGLTYGDTDVFISKFSSDGSSLLFSTILAGGAKDWCTDVDTDSEGNIYLCGVTASNTFFQNNSEQPTKKLGGARGYDAWIAKITPLGVIEWCRFFGGTNDDWCYSIGVDSNQNTYITGSTFSNDFALLRSGDSLQGQVDCYLAKFNSSGHLLFSRLIGSTSNDWGMDIKIDSADNVVMAAGTVSMNFPLVNPQYDEIESMDGIVMKFNSNGDILFATPVGGSGDDWILGIDLDEQDDIYFTGRGFESSLEDCPLVTNDYSSFNSPYYEDVFVGKMTKDGQKMKYLTVIGGDHNDYGMGVEVDEQGNAYIVGETSSSNFLSREPFAQYTDNREGFLTILNPKGRILTSSVFGGSQDEICRDVKLTSSGNIILGGFTDSSDFPIVNAHPGNSTLNGGTDAYLMSISMSLPTLPKFPISFILWISISGTAGFLALIGLVVLIVMRKKRKNN